MKKKLLVVGLIVLIALAFTTVSVDACQQKTKDKDITVLVFTSSNKTCSACQQMKPVIAELQRHYNVTVYDTNTNPYSKSLGRYIYSVTQYPTVVIITKESQGPGSYPEHVNVVGYHNFAYVKNVINQAFPRENNRERREAPVTAKITKMTPADQKFIDSIPTMSGDSKIKDIGNGPGDTRSLWDKFIGGFK